MTVKVREYKRGGFEVDIRFTYPDGTAFRRRLKAKGITSTSAAKRWGEERERQFLIAPLPTELAKQEQALVPTLSVFGPRYLDNHVRANQQKASTISCTERIFANHLYPALGNKQLDKIGDEDVQRLKAALAPRKRKTVNNVLMILSHLLKTAVKWKVIPKVPCTIEFMKVSSPEMTFYDFEQRNTLAEAAHLVDARAYLVVLLGADAGLRRGEMLGLRWTDIDFKRRRLNVQEAVWEGRRGTEKGRQRFTDTPKGGRSREVPLTEALFSALKDHRHLRGDHVLYGNDGKPATGYYLRDLLEAAQKRANFRATGGLHILRHTFCSHLAMRGAPVKSIQKMAGHADLTTTMRYMHLSPSELETAIALLNPSPVLETRVETGI
jgi:integrase